MDPRQVLMVQITFHFLSSSYAFLFWFQYPTPIPISQSHWLIYFSYILKKVFGLHWAPIIISAHSYTILCVWVTSCRFSMVSFCSLSVRESLKSLLPFSYSSSIFLCDATHGGLSSFSVISCTLLFLLPSFFWVPLYPTFCS